MRASTPESCLMRLASGSYDVEAVIARSGVLMPLSSARPPSPDMPASATSHEAMESAKRIFVCSCVMAMGVCGWKLLLLMDDAVDLPLPGCHCRSSVPAER